MKERRTVAKLYLIVAAVNDYRLTVSPLPDWETLKAAEQELIDRENRTIDAPINRATVALALDLLQLDIRRVERGEKL